MRVSGKSITYQLRALGLGLVLTLAHSAVALAAQGDVIGLQVWQPAANIPKLILPEIEGEAPAITASKYAQAFTTSKAYRDMDGIADVARELRDGTLSPYLLTVSANAPLPTLVVSNHAGQLRSADSNLHEITGHFAEAGADPFVVPLGLETSLDRHQLQAYHRELRRFPFLVLIGGDDLHPRIGGTDPKLDYNVNLERDMVERLLAQGFIHDAEGYIFGICRGYELIGRIMGLPMISNLDKSITPIPHSTAEGFALVPIELLDKFNYLYLATGKTSFEMPAFHHQALAMAENSRVRIVATDGGWVVMAIEFRNGKGAGFQGHPEVSVFDRPEKQQLISGVVEKAWRNAGLPPRFRLPGECEEDYLRLLKSRQAIQGAGK